MGVTDFKAGDLRAVLVSEADRCVFHETEGKGYEPETRAAWAKALKGAQGVIDVGAYTGLYSILAAKAGANVLAFEPMPANEWRFGINAAMNGVKSRVRILRAAASDKPSGEAALHFNPRVGLTTGASLVKGDPAAKHDESLMVPTMTIDRTWPIYFKLPVSLIKIDVEGAELSVLAGAREVIEKHRPVIFCETLSPAMSEGVTKALPRYIVAAVHDGRNTVFTPEP